MSRLITLGRLVFAIAAGVACSGAFLSGHGPLGGMVAGAAMAPALPSPSGKPTKDNCLDPSLSAPAAKLSRLSKAEYSRTLWDLLGAEVANSLPALSGLIAGIPDDDMQGGFANVNWTLSADHVAGYLGVANEIGVQMVSQDRVRRALLPCVTDPKRIAKRCLNQILDTFAARAYRRPLTPGERDELLAFYAQQEKIQGDALALRSLIARLLMSPQFVFKLTSPAPGTQGDCEQLLRDRSFTRASRIAYSAWGTMPDAALMSAAGTAGLLNDEKLAVEVTRVLREPKAREWLRTFFRQWLHYERFPVEGYSWPFLGPITRAHLHDDAAEELDRFIDETVWTDEGNYRDLLTSQKVFTDSLAIRQIYGLPKETSSAPEQLAADHPGILTRVAMLVNGFDDASVVKRGAFIRRQILCDALAPPDPSLLPPGSLVPPAKDHRLTTRQRWEARTAPTICQGCHRMINPLGFSMEAYDGIGRFRTTEKQPIPDSSPQAFNDFPIDTRVAPFIEGRSDPLLDGPVELSAFIGNSRKANACFVKQLNTFVSGRAADASDKDALQSLTDELMGAHGSIKGVLFGLVKLHAAKY